MALLKVRAEQPPLELNILPDKKIVKRDYKIVQQVTNLYKKWRTLEHESRRPNRASKPAFLSKEEMFVAELSLPFNVTKVDAPSIIQKSGIKDSQHCQCTFRCQWY